MHKTILPRRSMSSPTLCQRVASNESTGLAATTSSSSSLASPSHLSQQTRLACSSSTHSRLRSTSPIRPAAARDPSPSHPSRRTYACSARPSARHALIPSSHSGHLCPRIPSSPRDPRPKTASRRHCHSCCQRAQVPLRPCLLSLPPGPQLLLSHRYLLPILPFLSPRNLLTLPTRRLQRARRGRCNR